MLVLSYADVERLLPMEECVDVMEDALAALARGELFQPLRSIARPPDAPGLIGLMPAYRAGDRAVYALKALTVTPENPARHGLDAHQGGVLVSDGETGELLALVNASAITEIRTAAVSAVATRHLARDETRELAMLGAGVQARSHLRAMAAVRPFERARVWSPTEANARRLADEADAAFPVEVAGSVEEALRGADVIVTATAAREPVVRREWLADGAHVNAVGAGFPHTRELDGATVAAAKLVVDRRESAENEAGDYLLAVEEGAIGRDHIHAELGEVVIGVAAGRLSRDEITLFKSVGIAIEDLAAADHVIRKAREQGVGVEVPF
ncbi:MAG: ornithine cyclodeaminase family protein [Thermoleophilia bacterium]|nr:ornithine cyclodeaminase family protein [Thermoleophilia bacterium]